MPDACMCMHSSDFDMDSGGGGASFHCAEQPLLLPSSQPARQPPWKRPAHLHRPLNLRRDLSKIDGHAKHRLFKLPGSPALRHTREQGPLHVAERHIRLPASPAGIVPSAGSTRPHSALSFERGQGPLPSHPTWFLAGGGRCTATGLAGCSTSAGTSGAPDTACLMGLPLGAGESLSPPLPYPDRNSIAVVLPQGGEPPRLDSRPPPVGTQALETRRPPAPERSRLPLPASSCLDPTSMEHAL